MANEFIIKNGFHSKGDSQITGSINVSGVITGDGSGLNNVSSTPPAGTVSSSAQIASDISGSFTAPSSSFSTRVSANEVITAKTLVSSSAQIATQISGAFTAASGGFSSRVTTLEGAGGGGSGIFTATGSIYSTSNDLRITGSVFIDDTTTNSGSTNTSAVFKTKGTLGNLFTVTNDLEHNLLNVKDISGVTLFKVSGSGEILITALPTTQPTTTGSIWVSGSGTPPGGGAGSGYLMVFTGGG